MDQIGEMSINLLLPLNDLPAILGSAAPIGIQQVIPNEETRNLASGPHLSQIAGTPMIRFIDFGYCLVELLGSSQRSDLGGSHYEYQNAKSDY